MLEVIFLIVLGLVYLIFASIQDVRKTEVANWLSFSLIAFALGFRFFYSLFTENFMFFYQGLIGLGIFFVLGNLLYYGRLFAGGDAKLMIALGTVLPLSLGFFVNLSLFALFLGAFLFTGFFYGLIWSFVLTFKDFKKFRKEFSKRLRQYKFLVYLLMLVGLVLMIFGFYNGYLFSLGILIFIFPSLYLHAKIVDEVFMTRTVKPSALIEGDWLVENVKIGRRMLKKNWEGLSKEDIVLIKKSGRSVKIKFGIAFVAVFLISFVIFVILYYLGYSFWGF